MGPYKIHTMNEGYQNTILRFIGFHIRRIKSLNIKSNNKYMMYNNIKYLRCQMISVGDKIYLNGIITKQNENPLSDIWAFCPAKGEIDSNAGKLERPTCMNCCIRKFSSLDSEKDTKFLKIHFFNDILCFQVMKISKYNNG